MKKTRIHAIILGILVLSILSSLTTLVRGSYSEDIKIDGIKDPDYSIIWGLNYCVVHIANDYDTLFVYFDFQSLDLMDKYIYLKIGIITIDLSNETIKTNTIESIKNETRLEFGVSRSLVDEATIIKITIKEFVYTRGIFEFFPIFYEDTREAQEMSEFWLSWGITILSGFIFLFTYHFDKFRHKRFVECWVEEDIDGKKVISKEMQLIGEYVSTELDPIRNMYKLTFKHNLKKQIIYSEFSFEEYISEFKLRRYLFIIYMIEAYKFERKLDKPREINLEYPIPWKVYLAFKTIYQFTIAGIPSSFLLTGIIASAFFNFNFGVFIIGGLIGITIAIVNSYLYEKGIIKPTTKKEEVDSEFILFPIQPKYKIDDYYEVRGEKSITVEKADKEEKEWVPFHEKAVKFEKLQEYINSELYRDLEYIKIKEEEILRNNKEIKQSRHSSLYQMRYLYNQLLNSRANNRRLQHDNRTLYDQLAYFQESMDKERKKYTMDILLEQQRTGKTFKDIIKQIYGDQQIDLKWDQVVERSFKKIEELRRDKQYEKLEIMVKLLVTTLGRLGLTNEETGVEINHLIKELEIKEDEILAELQGSEGE